MHFGDLDFIVTVGGELALAHFTIQSLPSISFGYRRLECQPGVSLGPQPSREAPRRITLSPERSSWSTSTAFPFGLRNATVTASHLMALRMVQPPMDSKFVGVIEHDT